MFQALGLSPGEENLYTVLIHSPRSTVAELASYGSVSSQQATRDLHRLVRHGLANRLPGRQGRYIAVAPDIAIEPLLAKREDELRQARPGSSDPIKSTQHAIATCFIVRPCDLLDSLIALFEAEWERALPLRAFLGEGGEGPVSQDAADPDETRTAVLSCLAAGLTDEGIARSLGCSLRTAQRHIGRLMHDLNASSRFQA